MQSSRLVARSLQLQNHIRNAPMTTSQGPINTTMATPTSASPALPERRALKILMLHGTNPPPPLRALLIYNRIHPIWRLLPRQNPGPRKGPRQSLPRHPQRPKHPRPSGFPQRLPRRHPPHLSYRPTPPAPVPDPWLRERNHHITRRATGNGRCRG